MGRGGLRLEKRKKKINYDYPEEEEQQVKKRLKNAEAPPATTSFRLRKCSTGKEEISNDGGDDVLVKKKNAEAPLAKTSFRLRKCSTGSKKHLPTIKNGDKVDLSKLLFTKQRNYLIKFNDHDHPVQAKHLEGKVTVLLFVPLLPWTHSMRLYITSLVDVYNALQRKGVGFEVVFIGVKKFGKSALDDPHLDSSLEEKRFKKKFSSMPWTAIPFSDIKSLKFYERRLRFPISRWISEFDPATFVIDPTGVVLQCRADEYFVAYGAEGYPFTDQRIDRLISQDKYALKHPSITRLLTSPERNYVINKENQAVPVRDLEDKVVALFFYYDYPLGNPITNKLKMAYKQLANKENFEIVLVHIHNSIHTFRHASEESFWKCFNKMPWLALPFKDQKCKDLRRIFNLPSESLGPWPDPSIVIIGPQGKFVQRHGVDILENFGISAYPFTLRRVAELEAEYIKKLKLDMFWDPDTSFIQKDGPKVKLSELVGKRIILIAENDWFYAINSKFWRMLKAKYLRLKCTDDEFEVIHVCFSSNGKHVATMPWLRHPPPPEGSCERKLLLRLLRQGVGLLAFDGDGRVVRRTIYPWMDNMDFPFYAGGLEKEAVIEIKSRFEWDEWDF